MSNDTTDSEKKSQLINSGSIDVLPCQGNPLLATVCGCNEPWRIKLALDGKGICPFGRPWGCPIPALESATDLTPH